MRKRIMSLALVIAIFVGAFGGSVFAEDTGLQKSLTLEESSASLSAAHNKFKDVDSEDWFYSYVVYAYGNGLVNGTGDSTYEPFANMTRAMFATIIYRIYEGWGKVESKYITSDHFTDVDTTAYYYNAVSWCYNVGIVAGTGEHIFSPNASITREQAAKMIGILIDISKEDGIPATNYTDAANISDWAMEYINILTYYGIMTGYTDGTFLPGNTINRAEATKIVSLFYYGVTYTE